MKRKLFAWLLTLSMLVGLLPAMPLTAHAATRDAGHFTVNDDGTEYTIHDAAGWETFCDCLLDSSYDGFSGKTVQLAADVGTAETPVTRMAGTIGDNAAAFRGAFDGCGHTLTFANTAVDDNYIAPFRCVAGSSDAHACVHDLNVAATITSTGYRHLCGLIALTKGYADVYGCDAVIDIRCAASTENTELYPAGIVSQVSSDSGGTVTITGCTTAGTITTGGKYAGGIVGIVQGKATVENCLSSVVIQSTVDGDGTHGGLAAVTASNSTTLINGCVFRGKLLTVGENDTGNCGGILGWKNANVAISNCLYDPAPLADGEKEVAAGSGDYPSGTFYRGSAPTITNCYYTRTLGAAQATQAYTLLAGDCVSVDYGTAANTFDVSGLTVYANGLFCSGKYYCAEGTSLPLSYEPRTGYTFTGFQVNGSPLSGSTLTMPAGNVTVTAVYDTIPWSGTGTEADPYVILYPSQLDLLARRVNAGNEYSGVFFRLGADIAYDPAALTIDNDGDGIGDSNYTAIGESSNFCGHFDGQNHVVSGVRIYKIYKAAGDYSAENQGLFGELYGSDVEVKNVILADAIITGAQHAGGIAGRNHGGTVSGCRVLSDVTIHGVQEYANYHGGIAGGNDGTVIGCVSAASITTDAEKCDACGGIVGINPGTLRDCIYLGSAIEGKRAVGAIAGESFGAVENCCFTDTQIQGRGSGGAPLDNAASAVGFCSDGTVVNCGLARTVTLGDGVTLDGAAAAYPASGLTAWGSFAVQYDNDLSSVLYSVEGSQLPLRYDGEVPAGYVVDGYSATNGGTVSGSAAEGFLLTMPAADVTVTATFRLADYAIIIDSQIQHGSVRAAINNEPAAAAHFGDTVTLFVTPDEGRELASLTVTDANNDAVSLTGSGINCWTFTMPASDVKVTAQFAAEKYAIIIADMTNGSVTASVNNAPAAAAHYGDVVALTVVPAEGYRLDSLRRVTGNEDHFTEITERDEDGNYIFTMPAGNVTITASFIQVFPVVIRENIPNGTLTASVTEAAAGEVVTLTAVPDQGFVLVENGLMVYNRYGYDPTVTNNQFVMPANSVTVDACFLPPAKPVSCIDETGAEQTVNAYPLTENAGILPGGWYVAEGEIDRSENLELHHTEDICLILADGCSLTITSDTPIIGGGSDLYLYGQTGQSGCLTTTGDICGIAVGALWVSGGRITALGGDCGIECLNADFTIYAGTVEAIGMEDYENLGIHATNVNIYGGSITARANDYGIFGVGGVFVHGGNVSATGGLGGFATIYSIIELGWTSPTDSICASSFCNARGNTVQVSVTDGQTLKYVDDSGKHYFSGTLTEAEIGEISGRTLLPAELWTVNLAEISNGFLTADTTLAEAGDPVTVVVNMDSNNEASLTVTDADGNAVPVTAVSSNRFTFTMPASDVTVSAAITAYYDIYVVRPLHGALTASALRAAAGETVTLTAVPDEGFVLVENGLIVQSSVFLTTECIPVTDNQFTMPANNVTVSAAFLPAAKTVRYIDADGTEQSAMAYPLAEGAQTLPGGWYVAEGTLNLLQTLNFTDDAHLILADGCRITVSGDSAVLAEENLTVYGQSGQTGSFAAKAPPSSPFAFALWEGVAVDGSFTVCGGNVISAANGNRCIWVGDAFTVIRGTVEAVGNDSGLANNGILCDSCVVRGGAVSAEGRQYGLNCAGGCRISGGNVSFRGGNAGILDQGSGIELGWTEPNDSIYASSYSGSVTVAEDCSFVTDDDLPMMIIEGPISDLETINGRTLTPPGGTFVIHVLKTGTGTVLCPGTAFPGEIVFFTVIPTGSSALSSLRLTDAAGNELTLSAEEHDSWSFTMPTGHVTLEVQFEELYLVCVDPNISHGAVTADKPLAAAGELVTLNVTSDEGYVLVENSVQVTDAAYNPVPVQNNQFLMPAANVSVMATFLKAAESVPYVDETGREQTATAYPMDGDVPCLPGGWYVAEGTLSLGEFYFQDTSPVYLILADGCQLTVEPSMSLYCSPELIIYGQAGQTGTLTIRGGDVGLYMASDLTVCGGRIEVSGLSYGIRCEETVRICGGTVEAADARVGIQGSRICVTGGTVNARGDWGMEAYRSFEFYGGSVIASGGNAGVWTGEGVLLSWTNPTDSIFASSYYGDVTVAEGKRFVTDDDSPVTIPEGPVSDLAVISGKTLTPFGTYSITVSETEHGRVTAPAKAFPGDLVPITVAPKPGYQLVRLTSVTGDDDHFTEITEQDENGNYVFRMPAGNVTVTARFEPTNPFTDVRSGAWYYDAILWAYYHEPEQITNGTSATTFSPNKTCTRGQVVTFLWRACGSPEPAITAHSFTDVKAGAYYYTAMLWAVENGITTGTSATTFGPNKECTRAQVVTFLWRAAGEPEPGISGNPFTDIKPTASYRKAVLWAVEQGITTGTSDTTFSPSRTCTRAQVVTFLYRYCMGNEAQKAEP